MIAAICEGMRVSLAGALESVTISMVFSILPSGYSAMAVNEMLSVFDFARQVISAHRKRRAPMGVHFGFADNLAIQFNG